MHNLDALLTRARSDLLLALPDGSVDVLLWEYTLRVHKSARLILRLPEVVKLKPDGEVVTLAGLYHDAGYAAAVRGGRQALADVLVAPPDDAHREAGVALMMAGLADVVDPATLETAANVIRSLNVRHLRTVEAHVVGDAENLNKLGVLSLWPAIRRTVKTGAGVESFIEKWKRQREYRFWEARLGDAFHFEEVRKAARARVDALAQFAAFVQGEHNAADLADLLCASPRARTARDG